MRAQSGDMKLLMLCVLLSGANARVFNITNLIVPSVVPPGQTEVEIECQYDANFTLLNWFKGPDEFFRYKPGNAPSLQSFPIVGIGGIELLNCGSMRCRLRLDGLSEEATGLYRCDLERDIPPYKYVTRTAYMEVHSHTLRKPQVAGLAAEFGEGDEMLAFCRAEPDTKLSWYVNGKEVPELKNSFTFKMKSTRHIFFGVPPQIAVQCAEQKFGKLSGSKSAMARWKEQSFERHVMEESCDEQRNGASGLIIFKAFMYLIFLAIVASTFINFN